MPRRAREKSSSGIYHVVLRGINKQRIFEDDEDNQKYLETIKTYKENSGYEIYAYCLMSNHIHLLMKEGKEDLGSPFAELGQAMFTGIIGNTAGEGIYFKTGIKVKQLRQINIFWQR